VRALPIYFSILNPQHFPPFNWNSRLKFSRVPFDILYPSPSSFSPQCLSRLTVDKGSFLFSVLKDPELFFSFLTLPSFFFRDPNQLSLLFSSASILPSGNADSVLSLSYNFRPKAPSPFWNTLRTIISALFSSLPLPASQQGSAVGPDPFLIGFQGFGRFLKGVHYPRSEPISVPLLLPLSFPFSFSP